MHSAAAGVVHSPTQLPEIAVGEVSIATFDFAADEEDRVPTLRADWQTAGMSSSQLSGHGSQLVVAITTSFSHETPVTVDFDVRTDRVRLPDTIPISLLKVPIRRLT